MFCNQRSGSGACCCIAIIASIVIGAIIGVLFNFNLIPNIGITAWIAFGLSVMSLIILFLGVYLGAITSPNALSICLKRNIICLLIGIFGTLITSIAALSIVLNPIFPLVVALVSIGAAFFTAMLISVISFIACIVCNLNNFINHNI